MKYTKKALALFLALCMMVTSLPLTANATEAADTLTAALTEAKDYIDALTINNTSNDPEKVVKNFKTHFTWDNEKRENSKSYLFDWSYYNGVVFEGLEYVYEVTGEDVYKDYVVEYMSSLIASNGTWATCTNNSSKACAGYDSTHGADCYKTASLLLDAYEMTGDSRYLKIAETLYADLDSAANNYSLSKAGNNYRHTWASDPSPDLWLDGLYMILPFRAEYAKHIGDTEELDLIVSRMQWVSDNMYNSSKGLFCHAADSASSNSGTYWLRAIGWYAAAIVDVMDSMEGENLEAMKAQLVKLVDGMKAVQNESNGMWLNNMAASQSPTNPYETSGTALVCYAVMKAVNNGWLDKSYADMAILAFNGICNEKLEGTTLTDICFKGAPGSSNSTFYDNEGKGVGPFIMFYAEVMEYVSGDDSDDGSGETTEPETPVVPEEPTDQTVTVEDVEILVTNVTGLTGGTVTEDDKTVIEDKNYTDYVAYDLTATLAEGEKATISIPVPAEWNATEDELKGISVEDGELRVIEGTLENGVYSFEVDHFSAKGVAYTATPTADDETTTTDPITGYLPGGTVYTLDTDGVDDGEVYLIVSNNNALRNDSGNRATQSVTISDNGNKAEISSNKSTSIWTFKQNGNSWTINNGNQYLRLSKEDILIDKPSSLTVENQGNGQYTITQNLQWSIYYLRYSSSNYNSVWQRSTTESQVYLYKLSNADGEAVTFTLSPASSTVLAGKTVDLTPAITLESGTTISSRDITWESSSDSVATVDGNGTVTAVSAGEVTITATLNSVNGTDLVTPIKVTIPVTVATKQVTSIELVSTTGTVYVGSADTVSTGVQLEITYDDNSTAKVDVTVGMLTDSTGNKVSTATVNSYSNLTVTYNEKTTPGFTLNVIEKPDMNFPEYPDEGSVDLEKYIADYSQFQNTGVAEVQLTTSGIPAMTGVDVILVTDLSNSMAWAVGGRKDATSHEATKMYDLQQSVGVFADTFLTPDETESVTDNTITLVTFGGYDADHTKKVYTNYADPTQTLLVGSNSITTVKNTINNIRVLADDALNIGTSTTGYYLSFDGGKTYGENYGNTNYDHAFMQTSDAITALKKEYQTKHGITYEESGRSIYVLFMTDGAPSNYNGVYYNFKEGDRADVNSTWINSRGEEVSYTMGNNRAQYQEGPWYQYIAGGAYNTETGTIPGNPLYWADKVYNTPGVADVFSIGFDIDNGGFASMTFTKADDRPLAKVLEKLVTGQTLSVYSAENADGLSKIYAELASQIKQAATNAYFIDQMGDSFDIQMASTVTKFKGTDAEDTITLNPEPQITVSTYNIYTKEQIGTTVNGVEVTADMLGKKYGDATVVEKVTFNADGTEAYSTVNGVKSGNIIDSNGVICAENFWYNTSTEAVMIDTDGDGTSDYSLAAETFYWNIGTISNTEFVLSYYVYLTGAAEGEAEAGTYATNNFATLYYENWLGNDVNQSVDSPALAWESASVYYGFYLVDKEGQPVTNRATGATGSFYDAVKVTSKIFYDEVLLNDIEEVGTTIQVVSTMVPDGYNVYDTGATYTITIDSAAKVSGWEIVNTKTPDTTYVTDYNGTLATNITDSDKMDQTGVDYTATTVWFAVVWEPSTVPDVVVIDFGLPVDIGVLENDMFGSAGTLIGVGDIDAIPETVTSASTFAETKSADFKLSVKALDSDDDNLLYGHVSINSNEARYTPNSMRMCTTDKFAYEVRYENSTTNKNEYYYGDVTVIPATTIYYEDSFVTFTNGTTDGATLDSAGVGVWNTVGTENTTVTQEEDRPGEYSLPIIDANNVYGYDKAYAECSEYSLGSAKKVTVSAVNNPNTTYNPNKTAGTWPTATFTFTGSGFDIISLTSSDTGLIKVNVTGTTPDGTPKKHNWVVDTYYGYNYNTETGEWEVSAARGNDLYQIPVIKSGDKMVYGTYTVTITPMYSSNYDHTGAEEYDFYLDAIRVYDPANDETIKNAYVADNEGWPAYTELRNLVITANDFYADTEKKDGIIFIDGIPALDASDTTINAVKDYTNYGPNNELYLAAGQAVAFELNAGTWKEVTENGVTTEILDSSNIASIQLAVKGVNGKATYKIYDAASNTADSANTKTVETATDLYYEDINSLNGKTVVIVNTATEDTAPILSITNIKVTFKTAPSEDLDLTSMVTVVPETESLAVFSLRRGVVDDSTTNDSTTEDNGTTDDSTTEDNGTTDDGTTEDGGTTDGGTTEDSDTSYEEQITEVIETIVKAVKDVLNWLSGLSEQ